LIHDNRVYYVSDAGIVFVYNAQTGEPLFEERIESSTWASPLGAPGRIYFFGSNGATTVMATSDQPQILSVNSLPTEEKDRVYGFAACSKGFVIRTDKKLRAIFN
jgi:outer membrane protein assembly factor BamB